MATINYHANSENGRVIQVTVKLLVDKHNEMSRKIDEIIKAIDKMQSQSYDHTEVIDKARKDKRYPIQLMLQEFDRLVADLADLEMSVVTMYTHD